MPVLSLRARLMLGAALWTVGLPTLASLTLMHVLESHPRAPNAVHDVLRSSLTVWVAIGCMVIGFLHVRRGLSGVHQIRQRLSALHSGRERRLEGTYPSEVQPLVEDLNRLLEQRDRAVERAIAKAGDLAHGLKTPLAVIAHEAERTASLQPEIAQSLRQQVDRMQRQVDYHLAHARAAGAGRSAGARCLVRESAEGLARTLDRLHAERGIAIEICVGPASVVQAERADLDEMLGNLLDNACRWAHSRVVVDATEHPATSTSAASAPVTAITVDDDGPGLAPAEWEAVLQRGVRADESGAGSGLGLAIVRDLAELHGGTIALGRSPLGGLRAELRLIGMNGDDRSRILN